MSFYLELELPDERVVSVNQSAVPPEGSRLLYDGAYYIVGDTTWVLVSPKPPYEGVARMTALVKLRAAS